MTDKKALHRKRHTKNEIFSNCTECNLERLIAYWDPELEYYIYLFEEDEPVVCDACLPKSQTASRKLAEVVE